MADYLRKLSDVKFHNWMKLTLALDITKKGIHDKVTAQTVDFHKNILQRDENNETVVCTSCTTENVLPCTTRNFCSGTEDACPKHKHEKFKTCEKNVCNLMRDKLRKMHRHNCPSWKNTRANKWCESAWEVAKCFLPPDGYWSISSIEETDLNGILSIIQNMKPLSNQFNREKTKKVRDVTKRIRHSPNLLVEDSEFERDMQVLAEFLESCQHDSAKDAQQKIMTLKEDQINWSTNEVKAAMKEVILENQQATDGRMGEEVIGFLEQTSETLETYQTTGSIHHIMKMLCDKKKMLKDDLLAFNRHHHDTIQFSPLFEQSDIPLLDLYVSPFTYEVPIHKHLTQRHILEEKHCIQSLKDIFKKGNGFCREIYVTSKAGLGKTVFCNRIRSSSLIWCMAHKNQAPLDERVSKEDLDVMKQFEYLFLVSLRDAFEKDCFLDSMIQHQIIENLSRSVHYPQELLSDILHNSSCLIIVDGLDEWSHPKVSNPECHQVNIDVPHHRPREKCTILMTSRPWKFSASVVRTSKIDKQVEIVGLSQTAADILIQKAFIKLHQPKITAKGNCGNETMPFSAEPENSVTSSELEERVNAFSTELEKSHVQNLKTDPLMLIYLVLLWRGDKEFGNSGCEIYSNLIDLLLERAESRKFTQCCNSVLTDDMILLPYCLSRNTFCQKYRLLLVTLGKLAFHAFFSEIRENSLVFSLNFARQYLSQDAWRFCKEAGFVTMSKIQSGESKYSFVHKTMQEFLAALYVKHTSLHDLDSVCKLLNSVNEILSNERFFIYLSGLWPEAASELSKKTCEIVSVSEASVGYRNDMGSWNYFKGFNKAMKNYQDIHVACYKEYCDTRRNCTTKLHLCLEDIILDDDFRKQSYSRHLKNILTHNNSDVHSVKLRDIKTQAEFDNAIEVLGEKVRSIRKVDLKCEIAEETLIDLLQKIKETMICFVIKGGRWKDEVWTHERIQFSDRFYSSALLGMYALRELYLRTMKMTHIQLQTVVRFLSGKHCLLEQIGFAFISCIEHEVCPNVTLDLSRHCHLKNVQLGDIPVQEINLNTEQLEVCYLGHFKTPSLFQQLILQISNAKKLQVFTCGYLENESDTVAMLNTIIGLKNLKRVWLTGLNIPESYTKYELSSNLRREIDSILMINVKMAVEGIKKIVALAADVEHPVSVGLFDCDIQTPEDFERMKEETWFTENCDITLDGSDETGQKEFLFKLKGKPVDTCTSE